MPFLPVAAREVREASRQARTYRWRWVTAAAALGLFAFVHRVSRYSNSHGQDLFVALATAAFIYCLLAGAIRTSDTIAEEKRDNTLGLLFLTDLKGWDIIFGKLLSSSVNCFFGLLALFPMLAIPLLMGGVQPEQFLKVLLNLLNTLFVSISWGFLISALFRQSVVTISTALLTMIFVGGGVPLIGLFFEEELRMRHVAEFIFLFAPLQSHVNSFSNGGRTFDHYWAPLLINHAIGWINLRMAIFLLPRFWQEVPKNKKIERWRERLRGWRFGKGNAKVRFRTRLLNQNPLFWLSNREQVSSFGVMIACMIVLVGALLLGTMNARSRIRQEEMFGFWCGGMVLVHLIIAFRIAMAASYRLAEDRRSGALELLLGTEVSVREILRGHALALRRQFFGPAMIAICGGLFALALLLLIFSNEVGIGQIWNTMVEILLRIFRRGASSETGWVFVIVVSIQLMLMLNWIALAWVGMWFGLREKRSGFATWVTLSAVMIPPWLVLIFAVATLGESGALRNVSDDQMFRGVLASGWILGLGHLIFLTTWARGNLINRFREVAADRYSGPRAFPWRGIARFGLRLGAGVAVLILLLIAIRSWVDQRGEKMWRAALAAHPEFATKIGSPPASAPNVPDAENFARSSVFIELSAPGRNRKQINWNMNHLMSGRADTVTWNWALRQKRNLSNIYAIFVQGKIYKQTNHPSAAAGILEALAIYDKDLEILKADAAARPQTRFAFSSRNQPLLPVIPGQPWMTAYTRDLRPALRNLIGVFSLRASAYLAEGRHTEAFEDIQLAFRIAEGIAHDPQGLMFYHEILIDLAQPIYDGIAAGKWSNEQLKQLQDYYGRQDLWVTHRQFRDQTLRRIIDENERLIQARRKSRHPTARYLPTGFLRKLQAETLNWGINELPKSVDETNRRIHIAIAEKVQQTRPDISNRRWNYPDEFLVEARSLAFAQTTCDEVTLACAIERFRRDHQKLPARLEALAPGYIAAVPTDVFTGNPLVYKIRSDIHYVLYSIGLDGVDNGGVSANMNGAWMFSQVNGTGDWAWHSEVTDPPVPRPRKPRK